MTPEDKEVQAFVRAVVQSVIRVDLYPKSLIQVVVQELESDGQLLALALNCICAAILDSGISMTTSFVAVSVAATASGQVLVNPSADRVSDHGESGFLTSVLDCQRNQVLALRLAGRPLSRGEVRECMQAAGAEGQSTWECIASAARS